MDKIDFVITWVDGSDKKWLEEKKTYSSANVNQKDVQVADNRYRDMGTLKYWFRGVEKYAPWINRIFFVTWGHLPEWLNVNHPKLVIVNHQDYIPKQYLPTFNSNVIELNFHRIKELGEYFVNFNDDMFLNDTVTPDFFFQNGLPRGYAILSPIIPVSNFEHTMLNNMVIINQNFRLKECLKKHRKKFYSLKYGKDLLRTIMLGKWKYACGFKESHSAIPIRKSTLEKLWAQEPSVLDTVSCNKFRSNTDINQWLIENWEFMNGNFVPMSPKHQKKFQLKDDNSEILKALHQRKYKVICINDANMNYDYEKAKKEILDAFEKKFPNKSSFEK